jgi:outer membrane protein assembly factor BamE (lipoprotein component of BamABCDE complex)
VIVRNGFVAFVGAAALSSVLAACSGTQINPLPSITPSLEFREVRTRGYILPDGAIEQVPVGSSREQVLFVLGTPTTTANFDGEVFYYITQTVERLPAIQPRVIDQRVLAVSFDRESRVARIANYGLQDGRLFDFVSRTTPAGGRETTFLQQIFRNLTR